MTKQPIVLCTSTASVALPSQAVDIPAWLHDLSNTKLLELLPRSHVVSGQFAVDSGFSRIEIIGRCLLAHLYRLEGDARADHCCLRSRSFITPEASTSIRVDVTWNLRLFSTSSVTCELVQRFEILTNSDFDVWLGSKRSSVGEFRRSTSADAQAVKSAEVQAFARDLATRA